MSSVSADTRDRAIAEFFGTLTTLIVKCLPLIDQAVEEQKKKGKK